MVDNKSPHLHLSAQALHVQKQNVRHVHRLCCSGSAGILTKISRFRRKGGRLTSQLRTRGTVESQYQKIFAQKP